MLAQSQYKLKPQMLHVIEFIQSVKGDNGVIPCCKCMYEIQETSNTLYFLMQLADWKMAAIE